MRHVQFRLPQCVSDSEMWWNRFGFFHFTATALAGGNVPLSEIFWMATASVAGREAVEGELGALKDFDVTPHLIQVGTFH